MARSARTALVLLGWSRKLLTRGDSRMSVRVLLRTAIALLGPVVFLSVSPVRGGEPPAQGIDSASGPEPAAVAARIRQRTDELRRDEGLNALAMAQSSSTHSKAVGYLLWIFGFMGSHRFYYWTLNRQIDEINEDG